MNKFKDEFEDGESQVSKKVTKDLELMIINSQKVFCVKRSCKKFDLIIFNVFFYKIHNDVSYG